MGEQQYRRHEGPYLQALRSGPIVTAPDLLKETRWGGYPQRAMTYGVSAVYCSPLMVRSEAVGVLRCSTCTRQRPARSTAKTAPGTIAQIVTLTAVAITGALRNYSDVTLTDQPQEALSSRWIIDQTLSIIMGTRHCTAEQALDILRSASRTRNTGLAVIAQNLVDRNTE